MQVDLDSSTHEGEIFLIGSLRSGTTMLRLMIDHHPDITFPGEFGYVAPMVSDEGDFPDLEAYYDFLESNRGFLEDRLIINKDLDFPRLCHSFLTQRRKNSETRFIGSTVHHHFNRLAFIWPKARYIRIIRDGRDVARSFIQMGWAGNVWKGVEHWIDSERQWRTFKNNLSSDSWIEIKYEDLLENPEDELTRLCTFIGVPFKQDMLSYPQKTTYSSPDPSFAYQWKSKQSQKEIRLLESRIGTMLNELGYESSGLPSIDVTPFMAVKLKLQNKIYCWRFEIKRYGLTLCLQEKFARRLGLKRWHKQISSRKDKITLQYLK